MPTVRFTRNIQRHVQCPTLVVTGATLREVFDAYFEANERARGYVLDDLLHLRLHMAAFIDGQQVGDRAQLTIGCPTTPSSMLSNHFLVVKDELLVPSSRVPRRAPPTYKRPKRANSE